MKIVGVETYRVDVPVAPIEWRAGLPRILAVNLHLCCGVRNTTYYESIVANPVVREAGIDAEGFIAAPTQPGIGFDAAVEGLVAKP